MMATTGHLGASLCTLAAARYCKLEAGDSAFEALVRDPVNQESPTAPSADVPGTTGQRSARAAGPKDRGRPGVAEAPHAEDPKMLGPLRRVNWMLGQMPRRHRRYCLDPRPGELRLNRPVLDWLMETGTIPSLQQMKAWQAQTLGGPPDLRAV